MWDWSGHVFGRDGQRRDLRRLRPQEGRYAEPGHIPIYEPGLAEMVRETSPTGRLHFTTDLPSAAKKARLIFLAVGTPPAADGSVDLSALWTAANQIGPHIAPRASSSARAPCRWEPTRNWPRG